MILTLEYLQEKNVAHRDLKPANVMIGHNNYLKLIDFGEAKIVDNFEDNARNSNDQNTGDRRQSLSAKSDGTSAFFYKVLRKDKNQKNRKKQGTLCKMRTSLQVYRYQKNGSTRTEKVE